MRWLGVTQTHGPGGARVLYGDLWGRTGSPNPIIPGRGVSELSLCEYQVCKYETGICLQMALADNSVITKLRH